MFIIQEKYQSIKMKKLLGILALGLLWCNVGFAKDLTGTKLLCSAFANSERGDPKDQKIFRI